MSLAHRLWRQIPHGWRRTAFSHSTFAWARLKPASASSAPAGATTVVAGALRAPTGLGQAARLAIRALRAEGHAVAALDLTADLRQSAVVASPDAPAAELGSGVLLVFANPPVSSYVLARIPAPLLAGKRRIGCFVWEYDRFPADWTRHAGLFDEICAPAPHVCEVMAEALRRPVRLLPHPVALSDPPVMARRPAGETFTVGFVGDMVAAAGRKNPLAAIRAMAEAFGGNPAARLSLVLNGGGENNPAVQSLLAEARALRVPVDVDARLLSEPEALARYASFDAYLSLHRAEGFGLTICEAMLSACPTVATAAPPVGDLVDTTTGFPVPWRPVPAQPLPDLVLPGNWAEPDIAAAAAHLRAIRSDPAMAANRAAAGRERLIRSFGARAFCEALGLQPG